MGQDNPETAVPPARVDPDQAVVALAVSGDVRAFELLVRKYQPRIIRLIGRWVKDSAKCEDVAQDVFISTYRALPNFYHHGQRHPSWDFLNKKMFIDKKVSPER